ncbi:MAG: hypothetical protein QOC59_621 [Microbacteriaceae bacterium]|nr:hypothetical protein [Microbacteriaceae bacterium]
MSTGPTGPAPGWYPDPAGTPRRRYWDGSAWTEFFDGGSAPGPVQQPPLPRDANVNTPYIWLLVLLPLLATIAVLFWDVEGFVGRVATEPRTSGLALLRDPGYLLVVGVGWLSYAAEVVLAVLDHRALKRMGIVRPFHWAWSFLRVVYIIGRAVVVHRRTGRGLAPLWTYLAVYLISSVAIGAKFAVAFAGLAAIHSGTSGI